MSVKSRQTAPSKLRAIVLIYDASRVAMVLAGHVAAFDLETASKTATVHLDHVRSEGVGTGPKPSPVPPDLA